MPYHTMVTTPSLALDHCLVHQSGTAGLGDYLASLLQSKTKHTGRKLPEPRPLPEPRLRFHRNDREFDDEANGAAADAAADAEALEPVQKFPWVEINSMIRDTDTYNRTVDIRPCLDNPKLDDDAINTYIYNEIFHLVGASNHGYDAAFMKTIWVEDESDGAVTIGPCECPSLRTSVNGDRVLKVVAPMFTHDKQLNQTSFDVAEACVRKSILLGDIGLGPKVLMSTNLSVNVRIADDQDGRAVFMPTHVGLILMERIKTNRDTVMVTSNDVDLYNGMDRGLYRTAINNFNVKMPDYGLKPGIPSVDIFVTAKEDNTDDGTVFYDFSVWHVGVEPESLAGWWA